jgi:hypothetical protein
VLYDVCNQVPALESTNVSKNSFSATITCTTLPSKTIAKCDIIFPYAVYEPEAVNEIIVLEPDVVIVGEPVVTPE